MNITIFRALPLAILSTLLLLSPAPLPGADAESEPPGAKAKPEPNRLAKEKSPYLLQHADNPVDWYPWGEEAFAKAAAENKPILLSIGYSTCHWCHVMERESFEDEETAALMNEHFVCIKLDREERPDLDRIYMNYQQSLHGRGGWPLNVWLTPKRVPFFSGTYFPKEPGPGGPTTFKDILNRIHSAWEENVDAISEEGDRILSQMQEMNSTPSPQGASELNPALPTAAFEELAAVFDTRFGGFGLQPKFPQPIVLTFLLEYYASLAPDSDPGDSGDDAKAIAQTRARALDMVELTLDNMSRGGIFDHLGGGFHRYSVDRPWHVPHFEKMLYDQAQLASAYLDAHQLTGKQNHLDSALSVFAYVERDLSHPDGAFFSSENADSPDPDAKAGEHAEKEGAFYIWSTAEIAEILGEETAAVFHAAYDVRDRGNADRASDPFDEFTGKNILYRDMSDAELAQKFDRPETEIHQTLADARTALLAARDERPRPSLDDKILTAWNGLMISAYARAHQILGEEKYLTRAAQAAAFIRDNLYDTEKSRLLRSWRLGPSDIPAFNDDYAMFIQALLDLYETSLDHQWLELAVQLQEEQIELFLDEDNGGFFDASADQSDLILRLKNSQDGARPSGNSISTLNLIRLSAMLQSDRYAGLAEDLFRTFSEDIARSPSGLAGMLSAFLRHNRKPAQIVIAGNPDDPAVAAIKSQLRKKFLPNKVVLLIDDGPAREFLTGQNILLDSFKAISGKPTLYLCRDFVCEAPTNDLKEIAAALDQL